MSETLPPDDDVLLPHEGADAPPWATEAAGGRRARGALSDQTRFILAFVVPAASAALAALTLCCCAGVSGILIPIGLSIGCALYWGCPQSSAVGRWVYLGVVVLSWLASVAIVGAVAWMQAHP